jgi:hypothetical protein
MEDRDELIELEHELDSRVAESTILELPLRAVLVTLHVALHTAFAAGRGGDDPTLAKAEAAARRCAYLLPLLLRCPRDRFGNSARDALDAYQEVDPSGAQLEELLTYAHVCEVMPEVHRGSFLVRRAGSRQFVLTHPTPAFSAAEARDIVLSELALPYSTSLTGLLRQEFHEVSARMPHVDLVPFFRLLARLYEHHRSAAVVPTLVDDAGCRAATGLTNTEFARLQAAVLAFADVCVGVADALAERYAATQTLEVGDELLEWKSMNMSWSFVRRQLANLSELPLDRVTAAISFLVHDWSDESDLRKAGDGYLPPLALLTHEVDSVVFSPDLLREAMHMRNVLYVLNRTDQSRFDSMVSASLEPALLADAAGLFERHGFACLRQQRWAGGEIDLLVRRPGTGPVLQVQAKAAIPAQGARMVQALESRVAEGLAQLEHVRQAAPAQRDRVLVQAFGESARGEAVHDLLLSRTSFGREPIWRLIGTTSATNLPLLAGALDAMQSQGGRPLSALASALAAQLRLVEAAAKARWVPGDLDLAGVRLTVPMLLFDPLAVAHERERLTRLVEPRV